MDRQLDALRVAGCRRVFDDRVSGAKGAEERPGLKARLDWLREGDVLVVLDLDRLGRLAGELVQLVDGLAARNVSSGLSTAPWTRLRRSPREAGSGLRPGFPNCPIPEPRDPRGVHRTPPSLPRRYSRYHGFSTSGRVSSGSLQTILELIL